MYQPSYRRRNIGPLTSFGRFNSRSRSTRRYSRGRYGYAYPTAARYGASRRYAHIGATRGFAGYHLTNKEKKYLNTTLIAAGPASYPIVDDVLTATNVIGLNLLAEGTDYTNRISRKVHVVSVQIRATINSNGTVPCNVREMCVYDMQPNGAVPAITDILDTGTVNTYALSAPLNLNNRDRFRVVWDKLHRLDDSYNAKNVNYYKKCNYETVFNAAGAGVATVTSGALWWFAVSDVATAGTPPTIIYTAGAVMASKGVIRIRFVDG